MLDTAKRTLVPEVIRRSYLLKLGVLIGCVLVATGAAGAFFFVDISGAVTADTQNDLETTAEDEAEALSEWVTNGEQTVRMLSSYREFESGQAAGIERTMSAELLELPAETHGLHYIDFETHTVEHSTDEALVGDDLGEVGVNGHTQDIHGQTYESDIDLLAVDDFDATYSDTFEWNDRNLIAFFSPIVGENAVLMMTVDASARGERFDDPVEGAYTQAVDLDDTAVQIAADDETVLTPYAGGANSPALDDRLSGTFEQDDEVVAHAPVSGTDWVVVTHAPQDSAYALVTDVRNSLAVLIGVSLFGLLFIGATMGRTTARSLDDLAGIAEAVSTGNLDTELAESGRIDEVGRVQNSFRDIQEYLRTVAAQSDALANQRFEDPAFEEDVPGTLGDSLLTMRSDLQTFVDDLEAARREAETLADELETQAETMAETMAEAADGDLTVRVEEGTDNASMARIAESFNAMLEELEATVVSVTRLGEEVDEVSAEVEAGVEEIEAASADVSRAAEEISAATGEQYDRFEAVNGEMNDLSATVEEIASTSDEVAAVADDAAERATETSERTEAILSRMHELEAGAEEIEQQMSELETEVDRIDEIVDVIDGIAEETNVLALNASIEAARAGGDMNGNGFSVVADEVKSLAEETQARANEIGTMIDEIADQTEGVTVSIRSTQERIQTGTDTVESTLTDIETIADSVDEITRSLTEIRRTTADQAGTTQDTAGSVDSITELSTETADAATDAAAEIQEGQRAAELISDSLREFRQETAEALQNHVATFNVSGGATGSAAPALGTTPGPATTDGGEP